MIMLSIDKVEDRLRSIMESKGMTKAEFARSIGMSPYGVNSIMNGITKASLTTLIKVANKYHVSLDWLCGGDEQ